jgi:hypothetical protein
MQQPRAGGNPPSVLLKGIKTPEETDFDEEGQQTKRTNDSRGNYTGVNNK